MLWAKAPTSRQHNPTRSAASNGLCCGVAPTLSTFKGSYFSLTSDYSHDQDALMWQECAGELLDCIFQFSFIPKEHTVQPRAVPQWEPRHWEQEKLGDLLLKNTPGFT